MEAAPSVCSPRAVRKVGQQWNGRARDDDDTKKWKEDSGETEESGSKDWKPRGKAPGYSGTEAAQVGLLPLCSAALGACGTKICLRNPDESTMTRRGSPQPQ